MSRLAFHRLLAEVLLAGCFAAGLLRAEARAQVPTRRLLDTNSAVPPPRREVPRLEDDRRAEGAEEEKREKDEDKEPELSPGLLGYRFHGGDGLKAEYLYTGEILTNMRGGLDTHGATIYRGLFSLALTADLEKLDFFAGGKFFFLGENAHGPSLTGRYIGDYQWLSNIDGPLLTQVTEYWWERSLGDGLFVARLGKQDCNTEFAVLDLAGDFIHSSYGYHPTILMPSWPWASMGAVGLLKLREGLFLKGGVWDGIPEIGTWGLSGTGVTFSITELEADYRLDDRLPGDFHIGLWYHSGQFGDVTSAGSLDGVSALHSSKTCSSLAFGSPLAGPGDIHTGNYGVYFGLEQLLFAEPSNVGKAEAEEEAKDEAEDEPEDEADKSPQGLGVFVQYGWAPADRNEARHYFGSGLVTKGLLPGRDDDVLGLGVAHIAFSDRLVDRTTETAIELFYKVQLSPWTIVQPDLQYIARPNGNERDAFVFGLRFEVVL